MSMKSENLYRRCGYGRKLSDVQPTQNVADYHRDEHPRGEAVVVQDRRDVVRNGLLKPRRQL